jgi:dTDP-4-amino-4,6-dideoxygalactose transaminase
VGQHGNKDTVEEFWSAETLLALADGAAGALADDFMARLRAHLGVQGAMLAAVSGRKALEGYLRSVAPRGRGTVLISSFNCPVVLDAVLAAGLKAEPFDLADPGGRFDWEAVARRFAADHAAIVVPHLFGVPTDLRPLLEPARNNGTLVIEDCAHTLGGRIDGKVAGSFGDAAIFSFSYDKPLSLAGGGALLVADTAQAARVRLEHAPELEVPAELRSLQDFRRFLEQHRAAISRPRLLRTLSRALGKLGLGHVLRYQGGSGIGPLRAALGLWQLERIAAVQSQRNDNARLVQRAAGDHARTWFVGPGVEPAWLRQKLLLPDAARAARVSARLQRQGIRAGRFNWPRTIDSRLRLVPPRHAWRLARCGIDVPCHQAITGADIARIAEAFERG